MLTLLTTTGARPEAFALCERMMFCQDIEGPVTWVIVDDGEAAQPLCECREGWRRVIVRPEPFWRPGDNTQARNIEAGLNAAEVLAQEAGAPLRIAFIEDDDWYDPRWLSTVDKMLELAELVGEPNARYYNVAMRRGSYLNNAFHASLRASAARGTAIDALRSAIAEFSTYYDFKLWRDLAPSKHLFKTTLTVGMKGLPGRPGIAAGHREMAGYPDPEMTLLRQWIGDDADNYAQFMREDAMSIDRTEMYATGRLKKYENRQLIAGERFSAKTKDVRALKRLKFATDEAPAKKEKPTAAAKDTALSETAGISDDHDASATLAAGENEETRGEGTADVAGQTESKDEPGKSPIKRKSAASKTRA